jgi:hypothetical protein
MAEPVAGIEETRNRCKIMVRKAQNRKSFARIRKEYWRNRLQT